MEKIVDFIRQNKIAVAAGAVGLLFYSFLTISGKECFNCQQTETYKPNQSHGSSLRFRHK